MSIPLDRLYHYINTIATQINNDMLIYHFWPHGSKKIENLISLTAYENFDIYSKLQIICHDQEPLHYELYDNVDWYDHPIANIRRKYKNYVHKNIWNRYVNIYDYNILLHSEVRSKNLEQYQKKVITAYYWSHAIIALDWFRYAKHITQQKQVKKTFLIYNRAWSGTREYRLKFLDLLLQLGLENRCQTTVSPVEPELGIHYKMHTFENPTWRPANVLENFFPTNETHSHYSADFDIKDYESTDIEIVLETLFDDSRLHLTEKSLRPIACAQPFILAGTHGSLDYLRSYGFKTFGHIWDERYDLVEDPEERLICIANLMKQIANWDSQTRERKIAQAQTIAEYNKKLFFSKNFFNLIVSELRDNLTQAVEISKKTNTFNHFVDTWTQILNYKETQDYLLNPVDELDLEKITCLIEFAKLKQSKK